MRHYLSTYLAILMLMAAPASATHIYVSVSGGGDGTSSGSPETLAQALVAARAGDVVYMANGTYSTTLRPDSCGTESQPIVFIGNQAVPGNVVLSDVMFGDPSNNYYNGGDWISVKWITVTNQITQPQWTIRRFDYNNGTQYACVGDSVVGCTVVSAQGFEWNGQRSVIDGCTFTLSPVISWNSSGDAVIVEMAPQFWAPNSPPTYPTATWKVSQQVIRNSTFTISATGAGDTPLKFFEFRFVDQLAFLNNTVTLTAATTSTANWHVLFLVFYQTSRCNFNDNVFTITNNSRLTGAKFAFMLRDYTRFNQFFRNMITVDGDSACQFEPSDPGTYCANCYVTMPDNSTVLGDGQVGHNRWEGNTIKVNNPGGSAIKWNDGARSDTVRFNMFMTDTTERVLEIGQCDSLLFTHNLCWGKSGNVANLGYSAGTGTTSRVVANVFYSVHKNPAGTTPTVQVGAQIDADSLGLIFNRGPQADSSNAIERYAYGVIAPSDVHITGHPGASSWFTPELADSDSTATDARLQPISHAISTAQRDSFAGATPATNPINAIAAISGQHRYTTTSPPTAVVSFSVPWGISKYRAYLIPATYDPADTTHGTLITVPGPATPYSTQTLTISVPTDKDYWLSIATVNVFAVESSVTSLGIGHSASSPFFFPD